MEEDVITEMRPECGAERDDALGDPTTREELALIGIVGVNPDLAVRLLRFGYAGSPAA